MVYDVDDWCTAYEHIQYDDEKYAQYVYIVNIFYSDVYEIHYKLLDDALMR